jgi:hypothetical protein
MKDDSLDDPQLKSLEARLAAAAPRTAAEDQQRLLYQCAFAAARNAAGRRLRRWQAAAAALAVLLAATNLTGVHEPIRVAKRTEKPPAPAEQWTRSPSESLTVAASIRKPAAVALDAWQSPTDLAASFNEELARFKRIDPQSRALTLGAMTRKFLSNKLP